MSLDSLSPQQRPALSRLSLREVKGIFSSDILIRHALLVGIRDLRDNPWQLELVFASLLDDPFTQDLYGEKERSKAIQWFLKTETPVIMDYNLPSSPNMPIITVGLQEGNELSQTLSDTHYVSSEPVLAEWEPTTQKFNALYDSSTGLVTPNIPVTANTQMIFVDGTGKTYPITEVIDNNSQTCFYIQKDLTSDFSNCVIKWANNKLSAQLNSLAFKEIYNIGCHALGETSQLLYLFNIVKYCLLRYKKTLLEGRGYEVSSISYSRVTTTNSLVSPGSENVWSRFITINGISRDYWADVVSEKVTNTGFAPISNNSNDGLKFSQINFNATRFAPPPDQEDPSWMASDGIGTSLTR